MNRRSPVLIITPLAIAAMFGLIWKFRRQRATANELELIRQSAEKNLTETSDLNHFKTDPLL